MIIKSKHKGFTLIELITVMSIMAVILSLVGPLTVNFIDKAQAQSEFISLKNTLKKISFLSFASATPRLLSFEGNKLTITLKNSPAQLITYQNISFESQIVSFNSRGYTNPETLQVSFANKVETINLFRLVEGTDAKISTP